MAQKTSASSHRFSYLDLENIEGGWNELFKQVPSWITEIRKTSYEPLDKDVELQMIKDGRREEVINRNLRFVTNISRHYLRDGVDVWDIISAGNEALIEAYDKFDASRDTRFITYAVNLIRSKMIDELRDSNNIKLSSTQLLMLKDFIQYGSLEAMVENEPGRYSATYDTLSRNLNEVLSISNMTRLDKPFEDGSMIELGAEESAPELNIHEKAAIQLHIVALNDDERHIITMSFGLLGTPPLSIREIASDYGWSISKVAKVRKRALKTLSNKLELKNIFENNLDLRSVTYGSSNEREGAE